MLVCNVSQRPPRRAIAADVAEAAAAADSSTTGFVVFATLVDDPAWVQETVDAYLGEIMLEAASTTDSFDAGLAYAAVVNEAVTAVSVEDATTAAGVAKTWNPSDQVNITLSNGNLTATNPTAAGGIRADCSASSAKVYFEVTMTTWVNSNVGVGVAVATSALASIATNLTGVAALFKNGNININGTFLINIGTRSNGNIIGIAVDPVAKLIWFRVAPAGTWNGSGTADPATGTGGFSFSALSGAVYPIFSTASTVNERATGNFGATAFSGAVPSGFSAGF